MPTVSIVIPVLNDAPALGRLLSELNGSPQRALFEVIVADGGSTDDSALRAREAGALVLTCPRGRGRQLAEGAARATGDWVWLLHADSIDLADALGWLLEQGGEPAWGRFDIALRPALPALRLVARMMNFRSRLTGICTGDQGIFIHRQLLERCGGIPLQSLMEDIELSRRLKAICRPRCVPQTLCTSARRWRARGVGRTVVSMWHFRLRYWLGADPEQLAREYYR